LLSFGVSSFGGAMFPLPHAIKVKQPELCWARFKDTLVYCIFSLFMLECFILFIGFLMLLSNLYF